MTNIPEKYLNTNVRAMLRGDIVESEPESEPEPDYVFHLDRLITCFRKTYRLEIKLIEENGIMEDYEED